MAITILAGEYICIKFEQQEIRIFENLMGPHNKSSVPKEISQSTTRLDDSEVIELKDLKEIKIESAKND